MARKDSEHQKKSMSMLFRGKAIFKPLNTGHIDEHVSCVREWIANIFFYTKNGTTIMIDVSCVQRFEDRLSPKQHAHRFLLMFRIFSCHNGFLLKQ